MNRSSHRSTSSAAILVAAFAFMVSMASAVEQVDISKLPLPLTRKVDFTKEVWPIFKEACVSCHGAEKAKGKYRMDTREFTISSGKNAPSVIVGQSDKSPLVHMIAGLIEEGLMPPPSDKPGESMPLTKEQIALIRAWIDQGCDWPDDATKESPKELSFTADVAPLLKGCFECHGPARADGGFRSDSLEGLLKGGRTYGASVKPGDAKASPLSIIISGKDEDLPLPEKHKLSDKAREKIEKWISQGAK